LRPGSSFQPHCSSSSVIPRIPRRRAPRTLAMAASSVPSRSSSSSIPSAGPCCSTATAPTATASTRPLTAMCAAWSTAAVYAIAHIRGGQALGRVWYEDGKLLNKLNTFTDFIDVTDFLVAEGYAAADRVAALDGSAGRRPPTSSTSGQSATPSCSTSSACASSALTAGSCRCGRAEIPCTGYRP
jgi:hypothetical protein